MDHQVIMAESEEPTPIHRDTNIVIDQSLELLIPISIKPNIITGNEPNKNNKIDTNNLFFLFRFP